MYLLFQKFLVDHCLTWIDQSKNKWDNYWRIYFPKTFQWITVSPRLIDQKIHRVTI